MVRFRASPTPKRLRFAIRTERESLFDSRPDHDLKVFTTASSQPSATFEFTLLLFGRRIVALTPGGAFLHSFQCDVPCTVVGKRRPHRRSRFGISVKLGLYLETETKAALGGTIGWLGSPGAHGIISTIRSGCASTALAVPGTIRDWLAEVLLVV
jgi:hypothetical protein